MVKALIFDLGGTLIDDREMIYRITADMIKQFGKTPVSREEYDRMFTSNWPEIYKAHGIETDFSKLIETFMEKSVSKEFLSMVKLYPDTKEFLEAAKKKAKLAINTSYRRDEIFALLKQANLDSNMFAKIVGHPEELGKLKPHPESIINIAKDLSVKPEECVMIGDTSADVLCGKNSGAKTIAVAWGTNDVEDLKKLEPDIVAHSWQDVGRFVGV